MTLTSASSPARYASKVLAKCCRRVRDAEEDSAIITSAIFVGLCLGLFYPFGSCVSPLIEGIYQDLF
jgi:hypothetical protein